MTVKRFETGCDRQVGLVAADYFLPKLCFAERRNFGTGSGLIGRRTLTETSLRIKFNFAKFRIFRRVSLETTVPSGATSSPEEVGSGFESTSSTLSSSREITWLTRSCFPFVANFNPHLHASNMAESYKCDSA